MDLLFWATRSYRHNYDWNVALGKIIFDFNNIYNRGVTTRYSREVFEKNRLFCFISKPNHNKQ